MTKLIFGLLVLAFGTTGAFAQDYLNCGLKIADNDVDCPFIGSCPQKVLRGSKGQLFIEVNEGETVKGRIGLKKVILLDKKDKEKSDKISLFQDDENLAKVKSKKLKLIAYDSKSGIDYSVQKAGDTLYIDFRSEVYHMQVTLSGNAKYHDYVLTSSNAVAFTCEKLNKSVYDEFKAKKEAMEEYKKEKQKSQGGSRQ